jgi:DNA-binding GntR family transcriptional regulator
VPGPDAASAVGLPLAESVYAHLRRQIVHLELVPGEPLFPDAVAAATGSGPAPVRHALARLVADGLLLTAPGGGAVVAPLTVRDVHELFVIWADVGAEILASAATAMTDDEIGRVLMVAGRVDVPPDAPPDVVRVGRARSGTARWAARSHEMWSLLAGGCGDERLRSEFRRLDPHLERVFTLAFARARGRLGTGTIDGLAEHLRRRDVPALRAGFLAHQDAVHRAVVTVLEDQAP